MTLLKNKWALCLTISLLAAGMGGLGFWLGRTQTLEGATAGKSAAPAKPAAIPPTIVEVGQVIQAPIAQTILAVGTLRSDDTVIVRPEVSGRIAEIVFREGQRVAKGDLLIRLDTTIQRAELQQADANLALAKSRYDRAIDLHAKGFFSSQARDEAESNFKVAKANHELIAARLQKLDIRAPFNGIVGLRQISIGDYVREGQDIVNIEEIDPLKVDFRVPEVFLKNVKVGQSMQISLDAFPGTAFDGKVSAINPLVDAGGRSIVVRATVANTASQLRPGMFARVRLITDERRDGLTIPEQALIAVGDEFFVFRLDQDRAVRTKIEIGRRETGKVEISRGLAKDDIVIVAGHNKVRDGSRVQIAGPETDKSAVPPAATIPSNDSAKKS